MIGWAVQFDCIPNWSCNRRFKEVPIECVVDPGRILADIEGHGSVINGAHKGLLAGGADSRGTEEITTYFKDHPLAVRGKHKTPDAEYRCQKGTDLS